MNGWQIALIVYLVLGFFLNVYYDINGKPEKKPGGFCGFCSTVIVYALVIGLLIMCGAFKN